MSRVEFLNVTNVLDMEDKYMLEIESPVTATKIKDQLNARREASDKSIVPNGNIVLFLGLAEPPLKDEVINEDMINHIRRQHEGLLVHFFETSPPTQSPPSLEELAVRARQDLLMRAKYNVGDRCMVDRGMADGPIIYIPEGRISDIKINHDDKVVYIINDREVEEEHVFQFPEDIRDKSSEYYRVSVALLKQIQMHANTMAAAEAIERRERRRWPNYAPQYEARPVTPPTEAPRAESSSWNPYLSSFVDNAV